MLEFCKSFEPIKHSSSVFMKKYHLLSYVSFSFLLTSCGVLSPEALQASLREMVSSAEQFFTPGARQAAKEEALFQQMNEAYYRDNKLAWLEKQIAVGNGKYVYDRFYSRLVGQYLDSHREDVGSDSVSYIPDFLHSEEW